MSIRINARSSIRVLSVVAAAACVAWAIGAATQPATAQAVGITAQQLLRSSVSGGDAKESYVIAIEFAPGATTGRHTHAGDEFAVVLEGTLEILVAGEQPRRVAAGEAYHNPQGIVHETRNVGTSTARTVATLIIEKGKALTVPAK